MIDKPMPALQNRAMDQLCKPPDAASTPQEVCARDDELHVTNS
jgi:hypothetical protein